MQVTLETVRARASPGRSICRAITALALCAAACILALLAHDVANQVLCECEGVRQRTSHLPRSPETKRACCYEGNTDWKLPTHVFAYIIGLHIP